MKNRNLLSVLFFAATATLANAQTAQQPTTNWQPSSFPDGDNVEQITVGEHNINGQINNGQNGQFNNGQNGQFNNGQNGQFNNGQNGQFNNGQNGQVNNGQQANMSTPQISYLASYDITWQAAPQYANQPNVQAFVANYQGQQYIMYLSIHNKQVNVTIVDRRTNQQVSGRGEIAMDAIVFQLNANGMQEDGVLYINRMPRFGGNQNMQYQNMQYQNMPNQNMPSNHNNQMPSG